MLCTTFQHAGFVNYAYNDPDHVHAVTGTQGWWFSYDGNGNQISRNPGSAADFLDWGAQNRLVEYDAADGTETSMVYDAEGARIVRVEEVAGSETITSYVPGLFERRDVPVGVDQTTVTYSFGGSMIGYRVQAGSTSDERYYTVTDHLGSSAIQLRYGETATSAATRQFYTPFGDLRGTASNQLVQDRTFTGQIEDGSTGLMFYNARYYDPMIRRFVSPDTIIPDPANPQDFNRYSYVSNNPVLWVDPGGNRYCPPNDTACEEDSLRKIEYYHTARCLDSGWATYACQRWREDLNDQLHEDLDLAAVAQAASRAVRSVLGGSARGLSELVEVETIEKFYINGGQYWQSGSGELKFKVDISKLNIDPALKSRITTELVNNVAESLKKRAVVIAVVTDTVAIVDAGAKAGVPGVVYEVGRTGVNWAAFGGGAALSARACVAASGSPLCAGVAVVGGLVASHLANEVYVNLVPAPGGLVFDE